MRPEVWQLSWKDTQSVIFELHAFLTATQHTIPLSTPHLEKAVQPGIVFSLAFPTMLKILSHIPSSSLASRCRRGNGGLDNNVQPRSSTGRLVSIPACPA